ncbi:MAG: biotin/lipoyl-containing protein [Candidatus Acidiferrales bacterium]
MKLEIELGGKTRSVELAHAGDHLRFVVDGRTLEADAVEVSPGMYSILIGGQSLEARVEPAGAGLRVIVGEREFQAAIRDTRQWRRHRGTAHEAEGRQQVIAPMPGKIVRVLAKAGDSVEAGQGILVIEAMKMQNEVRSPKSGTIESLLVVEGRTVNAGEILAIVA